MNDSCRGAEKILNLLFGWQRDDAVLPHCRLPGKKGTTAISPPGHDWSR